MRGLAKNSDIWFWLFIVALVIIAALIYTYPETPQAVQKEIKTVSEAVAIPIQLVNHIQANLPEQDVFVEMENGSNEVWRLEGGDAKDPENLARTAYAAATATEHDPFKLGKSPLGPFEKGRALGFTLGEWLAASGTGTYTVAGDSTELKLEMQKLVPRGVYTVWCSRIKFPPNPQITDKPCGKPDGSNNVFMARADGSASFSVKMEPLEPSTKEEAAAIALAYHSDSKTYGAIPGDFGLNSHVHLFFLMPVPQEAMEKEGAAMEETKETAAAKPKPSDGWALHIDAKKHFPGNNSFIAHHYCKPVSNGLTECQLYDSDNADARLVGVEVIVGPEIYNNFSTIEKRFWHYHKTEIPKVEATLPDISDPQEAEKIVKSIEETYGKLYVLWDPSKGGLPVGTPTVTVLG